MVSNSEGTSYGSIRAFKTKGVDPVTAFYFAEGTCRPNFVPYFCIQNPGNTDAQVNMTFMKGDGTTLEHSLAVGRNSRSTVAA